MRSLLVAALSAAMVSSAAAQDYSAKCGPGSKCPDEAPCCSPYGQCGTGAYCLGGCDPRYSNSIQSCVPGPTCQDKTLKLSSLDSILSNEKYLGDPTKADWVSSGEPKEFGGNILLTMPQDSPGTLLASTDYVWYGKVSARLKTSRGKGVVTAFILLSDVQDEIDFEFVGKDLTTAQTNYYFQGARNYDNGGMSETSNTNENFHTYEIDWTPEQVTWSVDGDEVRTLKKSETRNKTTNNYDYPQTPARVQLSLWPGGDPGNAEGTREWAGGEIDWSAQDIQDYGYYYAEFSDVTIQCYDPPSTAKKSGSKSYVYDKTPFYESDVSITNKQTIIKSLLGSGTNMSADYEKEEPSASASASASDKPKSKPKQTPPSVPGGITSGNPGGSNADSAKDIDSGSGSGASGGSGSSASASGVGAEATGGAGFSQGQPSDQNAPNNAPAQSERIMQGSLFAGLVAVAGMLLL
ncbi:MAG: hypothetical protein M1833_002172 [Piccolia ochrophora]|nr:MAG: hypothetical protein M1833_002172 [Piccolia ochrophora]